MASSFNNFIVGDRLWWNDPDDDTCSGNVEIVEVIGEIYYCKRLDENGQITCATVCADESEFDPYHKDAVLVDDGQIIDDRIVRVKKIDTPEKLRELFSGKGVAR